MMGSLPGTRMMEQERIGRKMLLLQMDDCEVKSFCLYDCCGIRFCLYRRSFCGSEAKGSSKKKAKKGGAAAEGGGGGGLDEKEMKRMLEKLNRMTPKERKEWLEDGRSDELP